MVRNVGWAQFQEGDILKDKRGRYKHLLLITRVSTYYYSFKFIEHGKVIPGREGTEEIEKIEKVWKLKPVIRYNEIWYKLNAV